MAELGLLGDITLNLLQEVLFCYKKFHALKFQAIILPCSIAVSAFGLVHGCRHGTTLLALSGVMNKVQGLISNGINYNIYGNKAYGMGLHFIVESPNPAPNSAVVQLNTTMAVVRTCTSEWFYQIIKNNLQNLQHSNYQMAFQMLPATQYLVGIILINCFICLNSNIISAYFNCNPLELSEYLHATQW